MSSLTLHESHSGRKPVTMVMAAKCSENSVYMFIGIYLKIPTFTTELCFPCKRQEWHEPTQVH